MIRLVLVWTITLLGLACTVAQTRNQLAYSGVFVGEPLYIQNPYHKESKKFCITKVTVNNTPQKLNYNKSALVLRFSAFQKNDPVFIKVYSRDSTCAPSILNPDAIRYHSVFGFEYVFISDSSLTWKTKAEKSSGRYIIERFNYGYWDVLDTLKTKNEFGGAVYAYTPYFQEGINKFRIKYSTKEDTVSSPEVEHMHFLEPVTYKLGKGKIIFSRSCYFSIENDKNEVLLSGNGKSADISKIPNGNYYLVIDDEQLELLKWRGSSIIPTRKKKPKSNN